MPISTVTTHSRDEIEAVRALATDANSNDHEHTDELVEKSPEWEHPEVAGVAKTAGFFNGDASAGELELLAHEIDHEFGQGGARVTFAVDYDQSSVDWDQYVEDSLATVVRISGPLTLRLRLGTRTLTREVEPATHGSRLELGRLAEAFGGDFTLRIHDAVLGPDEISGEATLVVASGRL